MPIISTTHTDKEVELSNEMKALTTSTTDLKSSVDDLRNESDLLTSRLNTQSKLLKMLSKQHQSLSAEIAREDTKREVRKKSLQKTRSLGLLGITFGCVGFYFNETLGVSLILATSVLMNVANLMNKN